MNELNPYLQGLYAPVTDERCDTDLQVVGEIPRDLHGAYVRNGPNPARAPTDLHHWFDGDGMLHAVYFENGRAEYRNRYVRGADFVADARGDCTAGGVMRPANLARAPKVYKDTANTDVLLHSGSLLPLWYISGTPVRLDARTLETLGEETFGGRLPRHVSAHSKVDPRNGDFVFFDYALYEPWMSMGVVNRDNQLVNFQQIALPGPRLPHDMAFTEHYAILHDLPVVFSDEARRSGKWSITVADLPTRFGVIPRNGSAADLRWFETDPCYIYHVVNAWEEGQEIVMHACKMVPNGIRPNPAHGPYASMVTVLNLHAVMCEWRMNLATGGVSSRQLDDRICEFPVINLDRSGVRTRHAYAMSIAPTETLRFDGIYKYDLDSGRAVFHRYEPGVYGSEAAFAPREGASAEDDGYLVTFTTDEASQRSEVRIIDARAPEGAPLARIRLPRRVPSGFHATWARGDQIRTRAA
jgi:carotenoid cleavage dioxygenase-like enzyme